MFILAIFVGFRLICLEILGFLWIPAKTIIIIIIIIIITFIRIQEKGFTESLLNWKISTGPNYGINWN